MLYSLRSPTRDRHLAVERQRHRPVEEPSLLSSKLIRPDNEAQPVGAATEAAIEGDESAMQQLRQRHIFSVVRLRPAELVRHSPRIFAEASRTRRVTGQRSRRSRV